MDKISDGAQNAESHRVELENTRITLRNRETDVEHWKRLCSGFAIASTLLLISTVWLGANLITAPESKAIGATVTFPITLPTPKRLSARISCQKFDGAIEHADPGERFEDRPDLFPLVVSTIEHRRCFALRFDGEVMRDEACGYDINIAELKKTLCTK